MDITTKTSITQPGGAIIATGSAAQKMAAELGLRVHQTVSARVSSVADVTTNEKQAIMESRITSSGPSQPGAKALAEVLQSSDVRLIALTISGKTVHALTALPLQPSQNVQVRLDLYGNLVLVPQKSAALSTGSGSPNPIPATGERAVLSGLLQAVHQTPSLRSEARSALANEINRTLPQAQPLHRLLNVLFSVNDTAAPALVPKDAPAALKSLLAKISAVIPTADALQKTPVATLKTALQSSGSFYEHRIGNADHRAGDSAQKSAPHAVQSDLKNLLIQLSRLLGTSGPPMPGTSSSIGTSTAGSSESRVDTLLRQVMQLIPNRPAPADTSTDAGSQLRRLETLVDAALSQIQLNQYRSASAQLGETGGTVQNSIFIDLPVRLADGFISVFFQLQEFKVARRNESRKNERTTKKSRWVAFLELEVREQGQLAVELSVTDQQIDAVFWSDNDQLRRDTDRNLTNLRQQLEDRGLTVTDLRCSPNAAPNRNVRLDYSLIDVKT